MMTNFQKYYQDAVVPALKEKFGYRNALQVPRVRKIVVNVGVGQGQKDKDYIETVMTNITHITGQRPVKTLAKKSISSFKVREGMVVGVSVTLRGHRMWDFLEKLIKVTLPRVRDFRGVKTTSFDSQGNYSIGFKEHIAFAEIKSDEIEKIHGLEVAINTSAKTPAESFELLKLLGFPFQKD